MVEVSLTGLQRASIAMKLFAAARPDIKHGAQFFKIDYGLFNRNHSFHSPSMSTVLMAFMATPSTIKGVGKTVRHNDAMDANKARLYNTSIVSRKGNVPHVCFR